MAELRVMIALAVRVASRQFLSGIGFVVAAVLLNSTVHAQAQQAQSEPYGRVVVIGEGMDNRGLWSCRTRSDASTGSVGCDGSDSANLRRRGHIASEGHGWLRYCSMS